MRNSNGNASSLYRDPNYNSVGVLHRSSGRPPKDMREVPRKSSHEEELWSPAPGLHQHPVLYDRSNDKTQRMHRRGLGLWSPSST
jgi:hypothetical protein